MKCRLPDELSNQKTNISRKCEFIHKASSYRRQFWRRSVPEKACPQFLRIDGYTRRAAGMLAMPWIFLPYFNSVPLRIHAPKSSNDFIRGLYCLTPSSKSFTASSKVLKVSL